MNYDEVLKAPIPTMDVYYFLFILNGKQVRHIRVDALRLFTLETDAKMLPGCWKERLEKHLWKIKGVKK